MQSLILRNRHPRFHWSYNSQLTHSNPDTISLIKFIARFLDDKKLNKSDLKLTIMQYCNF
ncbi:hypothetical protein BpHYR1_005671 [Brachionus plicatilis]|uniref:Uncharacterized protein n=1 Tax=Brachionus plicatilis TaxID=10195 RepID=A0A3M7Q0F4_BRAPC|nr:hypothetical protein BpHYR1_005671 [Brachionus plicatilis]